jgi:hypothetical protein
MFDDVWRKEYNVVDPFAIPKSWRVDRAFDFGSAHPFAVGWFAESDGTDIVWDNGDWMPTSPGDVFLIREWYGASAKDDSEGLRMTAREIAAGIVEIENNMPYEIHAGPADTEIWNVKGKTTTLYDDIEDEGVTFTKADKSPGSRIAGWNIMRERIKGAWDEEVREPGFFVFNTCRYTISQIPALPRCEKNPEDVDTDSLDHLADMIRYRLATKKSIRKQRTAKGMY